jgi:hypothetical protein
MMVERHTGEGIPMMTEGLDGISRRPGDAQMTDGREGADVP